MLGDKKDKPSTPPPPQEAFEEFKKTRGVNINQVLMESKGELSINCCCTVCKWTSRYTRLVSS